MHRCSVTHRCKSAWLKHADAAKKIIYNTFDIFVFYEGHWHTHRRHALKLLSSEIRHHTENSKTNRKGFTCLKHKAGWIIKRWKLRDIQVLASYERNKIGDITRWLGSSCYHHMEDAWSARHNYKYTWYTHVALWESGGYMNKLFLQT